MEFCEEDVEYLRYFKVALAIAIIRQKPEILTAKEYTKELASMLREKEQDSHEKVQHLQTELFLTKQTLIQSKILSKVDNDETVCGDAEVDNILPTPPPSSEDSKTNKQEIPHVLRHAQFLKSVSFMCKKPYNLLSVFAGDDVTVVKETLLKIIKMLIQDSASKIMALPQNILQSCTDGIIDILECPGLENYQSELKVPALILVEHLIEMIMKVNVDTDEINDKISRVIVVFGCTPSLRNETLTKLTTSVLDISSKLRDNTQGRCSIRTVVSEYHSVYHVLWAIETILTRTLSTVPRPGTVKDHLTMIMEESLLHISTSFPVYACYVWRIQALLN